MTELLPPPAPKPKCCWKRKLVCFLVFLALIIAGTAALSFCPWSIAVRGMSNAADTTQLQQRVTTLENQVRALGSAVNAVNAHNASVAAAPQDNAPIGSAVPTADTAHIQSDLTALSAAVVALQDEVKRTSSHAAEGQQATQTSLASAISFIQLRATADAGQSFAVELSAMRDASKTDAVFQENLGKLDAIAPKGAPTPAVLRDELLNLEPDAALAIEKAGAANWWQRLLAELKTLVSIRKQHSGGETDAFTAMESDLAKGDIAATLTDMQSLPADAQQVLAGWRAQTEARQTVDTVLRDMAAHFTALANPVPPAQGAP